MNKVPKHNHKHRLNNKIQLKLELHHKILKKLPQFELNIYDLHNQIYYFQIVRICD